MSGPAFGVDVAGRTPIGYLITSTDPIILVAISEGAIDHLKDRISENTIIIGDEGTLKFIENENIIKIPFLKTARDIGGPIYANVIAAGG